MAGGEEDFGSLFEGMVVLGDDLSSPSDHLPPLDDRLSQPLDENLFSDLTITSPSQPLPSPSSASAAAPSPSPSSASAAPPSRPGARRKKRGTVRVGYARSSAAGGLRHDDDAREDGVSASLSRSSTFDGVSAAADEVVDDDERHDQDPKNHHRIADSDPDNGGTSQLPPPIEDEVDEKSNLGRIENSNVEDGIDEKSNLAAVTNHQIEDGRIEESNLVDIGRIEKSIVVLESHEEVGGKEVLPFSMEERLTLIREIICRKREEILGTAASLSSARKEAARRRRRAGEDVNSAAEKYKALETELEEACEAEDFERAEKVSERLLEVEQEKLGFLGAHKDAEKECDSIDLEMQRVLAMQIEAEAESAAVLEAFAKVSGSGYKLEEL